MPYNTLHIAYKRFSRPFNAYGIQIPPGVRYNYRHMRDTFRSGFALPATLIASLVMLSVLLVALQTSFASRFALDSQYYNSLARQAAEAGLARANACLKSNNYIPQWSGKPLRVNGDCTGADPCTGAGCYLVSNSSYRTSFSVAAPTHTVDSQHVTAVGKVELLRTSTGAPWKEYTYTAASRMGAQVSFNNVVFGYNYKNIASEDGAFFFTIAADGKVQATGGNKYGQLGVGDTNNSPSPRNISLSLPAGTMVTNVYTSMLSMGYNSFFVTNDGAVYGTGLNNTGALGLNNKNNQTAPQRVKYRSGTQNIDFGGSNKRAKYVAVLGHATFILTEDNYLYSAGTCSDSVIGRGCSYDTVFGQMGVLDPGAPATRPTDKIALDSYTGYVITEGGRVYGWGNNSLGQLADNATKGTDSSTPIQIGNYFGIGSGPKAVQVAFDGDSVYIADESGEVQTAGRNDFGQLGRGRVQVVNETGGDFECMDGDTNKMYFWDCIEYNEWQYFEFRASDSTIRRVVNGNEQCMDDGDGTVPKFATCNGSQDQKFTLRPSQGYTIYSVKSNKCLDNSNGSTGDIKLYTCPGSSGHANMRWWIADGTKLENFELPVSAGTAVKVATDQWSTLVLGSNGEVWGAGLNASGQLGNGRNDQVQNVPTKFILPAGVKAVDVFNTASGMEIAGAAFNWRYANTFVIGDNGKVYGAGDNEFGQLGTGSTNDFVSTPVAMSIIDGQKIRARSVQGGFGTTAVLVDSGVIYTVGNNSRGQLGDGTTTNSSTPKANRYINIIKPTMF